MTDPTGLPTTLATSYPTTSAGSVGYMMMSYPGRPPMVPMQPSVGVPYMPIGASTGTQLMPTLMPMTSMMGTTGMVSSGYRGQRPRKPAPGTKQPLIVRQPSPATISAPPNTTTSVMNNVDIPKGPPVTVFVGNITEKAPDLMIRQILAACGHVVSWKRVQAFGFCEFGNPDAALRTIRLLHDENIGTKKLVIKVDAKAQAVLEEYKDAKKKKKKLDGKDDDSEKCENNIVTDDDDYLDNDLKAIDEMARKKIKDILSDYHDQLQQRNIFNAGDDKSKTGAEGAEDRVQYTHQRLMQLSNISSKNLNLDLEEEYPDEGKRDLITREIGKFREIMKKQEEEKEIERRKREEKGKERERHRSARSPSANGRRSQSYQSISSTRSFSPEVRSPKQQRSRMRSRSRDREGRDFRGRERERSRDRDRDDRARERDRERDRGGRDNNRERDRDRTYMDTNKERERNRDRDRDRDRDNRDRLRERSRDRERSPRIRDDRPDKDAFREKEKEEELKEQRKQERAAREREASYQERLKAWETREKYRARDAQKEKDKRRIREEEKQKEAKRLKEFLEDYDDERDDAKFYKGREIQRRLTEREVEVEMDNRDRQKEKEELEELKAKIYSGDSSNPEYEFAKLLKAREEMYKPKLIIDVTEEQRKEKRAEKDAEKEKKRDHRDRDRDRDREKEEKHREQRRAEETRADEPDGFQPVEPVRRDSDPSLTLPHEDEKHVEQSGFNRSLSSSPAPAMTGAESPSTSPGNASDSSDKDKKKKKKLDVKDVFNNDDEDASSINKKRKLVPLDYNDDTKSKKNKKDAPQSQEEKRKHIKSLIDKIPTEKSSLFKYELDWSSVDNNLMEKRIRPWIHKKIIEYIGEPEKTLVDFICSKVLAGSDPQSILDDVQMVLDEEAEVFVVKMWRLLIYEVEAKKLGLMK